MSKAPFLLLFFFMLVPVGLAEAQVATPDGSGADLVVSIAPVTQSDGRVTLTASANTDDNSLGFSWSQIDNEAPAVRLQNAEKAIASFRIPFAVMEQTVTMSFSVHVTDGQDSATETIDVPVTLTVKPPIVLPPPESPSGFVETVLFEQQWDSTDGWTLDSQWGIESPMDTLLADTNNRVISIGECDGSCPLQAADEIKLFTYDGADLVFWVWFGDQILDTDSLNTEVMMVQARTADNWEDHHMVTVSESAYEQWFPVTINFDEFAGDDFFFRFMPILENDNSIIQIDAIQLIAKTRDDVKPVISNVPNDIILDVSRPSLVTFTLPTAVDNVDGTVPVICDPPGRVVYPFGTTTVTCISRDSVGNTASASFDVTLNRFIPLEIIAPDDLILEATGELTLVDLGTASINRDAAITNDAPDLFPLGSTVITWTAQDDKGDMANDTQIITIQDTTAPVIIPPDDIIHEATSLISMIQLGVATATDTVDPMPTITSDAPTSFPIGITIITYTATDDSGNSATATQKITIRDTGPKLILPSDVTAEATGVLTPVDIGTATVTDNIDTITAINDAPDSFPLGETRVTWTAKDSSENEVSAVQKVTIQDTTNPYFDTPESNLIFAEATGLLTPVEIDTVTARDIADPDVVVTNNSPDSFRLGSTFVIWTAKDSSGNTALYTQLVIVNDRTSPTITAPDDITIEATGLLTMIELGVATATDLIDRAPLITSDAPTSFPIGITIITYTATDNSFNSATDTQKVTVQGTAGPVLILPSDIIAEATGVLTPVDIGTATVTDNIDTITVINDAPDSFPVGETRVTWTAKDSTENEVTGIQTVIIRDTTQPTITVPDSIIAEATDELTPVDIGSATASDIADSDVTVTNDSPDSFPVGSTVITWTATDDSGNTASDTQTVRIQDTTEPVFTSFPEDITVTFLNRDAVEFENPTATDIFPVIILCSHDSGDSFPAGSTLVTCMATDANSNSAQDSFSVIVIPPVIAPLPDPILDLSATNVTSDSLTLFWTQPDLNGGTFQTYRLVMTTPHGDPQTFVGLTTEPFFDVTDLTPDTDYSFRVQARTDNGFSGGNAVLDTRTLPLPDPVLDLSATNITSDSLTLFWTQPDLNGGTFQTYRLVMTTPHGDPQTFVGLTAEPFFEVAGLTPDTDYSFRVQARTDNGFSGGNAVLDTRTLPLPDPVLDLSATNITSISLILEWTQPDLNGGTFQTYRLVMTTPHGDPQTFLGLTAEPFFDVTDLTPDTDYSFRVQARTNSGYSADNAILDTRTLPVPPPDPVLDLSATNIASNFLRLEWTQPDLNGGTFQTYRLVMTTPHGDPQTFVGLTTEPFFDVTDLTPDTDYSFRVQARTDSGSSAGNAVLDTTTLRDTTKPVFTSFPDDIAVRSTNDTFVEFASPTATDLHPVTIQCNHNSGDLFFIGTTLVTCTATDTSNNFVQDSFSITVYLPSGFETITDGFSTLNSWESFKSASPKSEAPLSSTNDRVIFPVGSGSVVPAVLIRGQGIGINVGIQRDLSLENYNPLDPLYLGIDYRALSDNRYSNITNAVIEVQDTAGNSLHRIILFAGATFDSGWRTFSTDISQHVSGQDDIRVQLYLIDTWIDDWNQRAFFDNFYLGVDPPPT